jgi:hypothetical protein
MSDEQQYHAGGYVEGTPTTAVIHPGEYIITRHGDTYICVRQHDHGGKR